MAKIKMDATFLWQFGGSRPCTLSEVGLAHVLFSVARLRRGRRRSAQAGVEYRRVWGECREVVSA